MVQHRGEQPADVGVVVFASDGEVVAVSALTHACSSVARKQM